MAIRESTNRQFWVVSIESNQFCFLITAEMGKNQLPLFCSALKKKTQKKSRVRARRGFSWFVLEFSSVERLFKLLFWHWYFLLMLIKSLEISLSERVLKMFQSPLAAWTKKGISKSTSLTSFSSFHHIDCDETTPLQLLSSLSLRHWLNRNWKAVVQFEVRFYCALQLDGTVAQKK